MVQPQRRSILEAGFYVLVGLIGLVAAAPLTGVEAWPLELVVSFRLQILVLLVLIALLAVIRRHRWIAACLALVALVNLGDVAGTAIASSQATATGVIHDDAVTVKVLFANASRYNGNHRPMIAEIARLDPDVVVVAETTQAWADALSRLSPLYPHIVAAPREHSFGMMLLSRLPLTGDENQQIEALPAPSDWQTEPVMILANVETDAGPVLIAGLHPYPPLHQSAYHLRNAQLDAMAQLIAHEEGPVIAVGDLNATPWSPTFRRFLDRTALEGPNIMPTWPTILGPAGLAIDHILLSRSLDLQSIERGSDIGSDHRPLFAVVVIGAS
ncbi:MAG: endonuclease/exonuclease/phosphatase family protein [Pseudomonadota bacterium]